MKGSGRGPPLPFIPRPRELVNDRERVIVFEDEQDLRRERIEAFARLLVRAYGFEGDEAEREREKIVRALDRTATPSTTSVFSNGPSVISRQAKSDTYSRRRDCSITRSTPPYASACRTSRSARDRSASTDAAPRSRYALRRANPLRLRSQFDLRRQDSFTRLAGAAPIPASSGQTTRYRLDRSGDRKLNRTLHQIIVTRRRWHQPTIDYINRRAQEGKTRREATRCLKRYLARNLYRLFENLPANDLTNIEASLAQARLTASRLSGFG